MEPIEIYPVEESPAYVRTLEERVHALEAQLEERTRREEVLQAQAIIMEAQRERMTQLMREADEMLQDQIRTCRAREQLITRREDELDDREDYLVGAQIHQDEAYVRVRGLLMEE